LRSRVSRQPFRHEMADHLSTGEPEAKQLLSLLQTPPHLPERWYSTVIFHTQLYANVSFYVTRMTTYMSFLQFILLRIIKKITKSSD
jgi:hypothetical protein